MEQAKSYENKLNSFQKALSSLKKSIDIDLSDFSEVEKDTLKSGQAQKFEVCVELFWKLFKKFFLEVHGIECVSPKMVMKELYRSKYVSEEKYERLTEMINDRNRISHVYNEAQFNEIHKRLVAYQDIMSEVTDSIVPSST